MLYQEFEIPKYDWMVCVFYDTTENDTDDIMEQLFHIGCDSNVAKRAFDNLSSGKKNTGLTFSKGRETCMVLGCTTDRANFAHTYTHEIAHCAMHIAKEYGINPQSEEYAYIVGDLAAEMLPYASKYLCECCSKKKKYAERVHGEDSGFGVTNEELIPYYE